MLTTYLFAFLSVFIVSTISLVGVSLLAFKEEFIKKYIFAFISLAVGALLGDAFIHLIPEALESASSPALISVLIIAGILIFFIIEKFLHWHHHGEDHVHPVGKLILFSDGIHNLIDGVIIGVSFLVSIPLGIATTIAVILHEIPQEIGDFTVLLHSGYSRRRALWLNFFSALTAVAGVIIAFILGQAGEGLVMWVLPIAAGGFIYIAVADLIPELHKTKEVNHSVFQIIAVILGVLAMLALLFIE
ncbi:MAG: ZIP family metal transporter [Candidatus Staskawiczbacteria bacterium]|nr:ZIP family metal transporter [Candidatus Staskawiczbacteria bacterium]